MVLPLKVLTQLILLSVPKIVSPVKLLGEENLFTISPFFRSQYCRIFCWSAHFPCIIFRLLYLYLKKIVEKYRKKIKKNTLIEMLITYSRRTIYYITLKKGK